MKGQRFRRVMFVLGIGFAVATSVWATDSGVISLRDWMAERGYEEEKPVIRRFGGEGVWRRANDAAEASNSWHAHVIEHDDHSVKGRLSLVGARGLSSVIIEGHMEGSDAFGALLDEKGVQLDSFNASVSADGQSGTYVLSTGESGTWTVGAPVALAAPAPEQPQSEGPAALDPLPLHPDLVE